MRVGYRARACRWLAQAGYQADADLDPTHARPGYGQPTTAQIRSALQSRPGFGPYAAGQALRLLGHYDDLALDSAVRARLGDRQGDRALVERYAPFGRYAGLALWMDFSRTWLDHPKVPRD